MSQRITDFRIDRVGIQEARFYGLPAKAQELIRAYGTPVKSAHPDTCAFEIAAYRWAEINAAIGNAAGATS
jgi:hypothetical protein